MIIVGVTWVFLYFSRVRRLLFYSNKIDKNPIYPYYERCFSSVKTIVGVHGLEVD